MSLPSLDLLQQVVHPRIVRFTSTLIKTSASAARIHRLALDYVPGHSGVSSLVVKSIDPVWPDDPYGSDRELRFYRDLHPQLDLTLAHPYYLGLDPSTGQRLIVMEDAETGFRFLSSKHQWTPEEIRCILRTYARFHVQGHHTLPEENQRGWLWRLALQTNSWAVEDLLRLANDLIARDIWPVMPALEQLIAKTLDAIHGFSNYPVTLLHNDVTPANAALPRDLCKEAMLFDWEMAGWGMAELDLAYMFLQPFCGAGLVSRAEALNYYWDNRQALEGWRPSLDDRLVAQSHADALWALSLIPVAHKVANQPYPPGSAPKHYWDRMFPILGERLEHLCSCL